MSRAYGDGMNKYEILLKSGHTITIEAKDVSWTYNKTSGEVSQYCFEGLNEKYQRLIVWLNPSQIIAILRPVN